MLPKYIPTTPYLGFPNTLLALKEPNGLLGFSDELSLEALKDAYKRGIFPWSSEDEPILWWTPAPRAVLFTNQIKVSRSLSKTIRNKGYELSFNQNFNQVLQLCATLPRAGQDGTWLRKDLIQALKKLHLEGVAHSVEITEKGKLIGGLYGLIIGKVFYGESMFSLKPDASKMALVGLATHLKELGFRIIDCQIATNHLNSLGAVEISREMFETILAQDTPLPTPKLELMQDWKEKATNQK